MKYGMENSLLEQFYAMNLIQKEFTRERLKQLGLGPAQARTLNYIRLHPGIIQKDIAEYLGMQHASVTNLLKKLEQDQLITREILVTNERQKILALTEAGKKLALQVQEIFYDLEAKFSDSISEVEKAEVMRVIKKIGESFDL